MKNCKTQYPILNRTFGLFLQISFTFIFLTLFFFMYVERVEKESFDTQMDIVVDNLSPDLGVNTFKDVDPTILTVIDGSLDMIKEKEIRDNSDDDEKIKRHNKDIQLQASKIVAFILLTILLFIIIFLLVEKCIPFHSHLIHAIIAVSIVGLTEFIFLTVITENYWSVNPEEIRENIGNTMEEWIKKNKGI